MTKPTTDPEEPSRTAGACVLIVLVSVVTAAVFAISETAGVLAMWMVGALLLWRSARRRMSDSSATPPPPSQGDVFAGHSSEIARVQEGPGEGMWILYPVRGEEVSEP